MTTREQVAILRAIAEGDLDRHTQLRDDLQAAGRLDDYEDVLAAAFQVAVHKRLGSRYRHKDVVNLVAEARIAMDPTGVATDPSYVELAVRSILDDTVDLDGLPDGALPRAYKLICNYLGSARRLGDPDTFMVEVQKALGEDEDADTAGPPAPARRREVTAEDAAALAGMLVGLVIGIGLAGALGAVAGRRRARLAR